MPSKKKSKPSFQVPEELQTAPQAGWVYRSDEQHAAKEGKAVSKPAAASRATGKAKRADLPAQTSDAVAPAALKKTPPEKSKPAAKTKSDSSSDTSSGIIDLTAKALSAGFGTAGGLILLTTTLIAAPFALGKRFMHL